MILWSRYEHGKDQEMVWSDPKSLVMMLALMWKSRARAWMRWCAAEVGQISGVFVFVAAFLYLYMYLYFYIRVCICIYVSVFVFVCLYLGLAICIRWKIGWMLWCAAEVWQISGVPPKQTKQPADNERHDSFLTKKLLLYFHFSPELTWEAAQRGGRGKVKKPLVHIIKVM